MSRLEDLTPNAAVKGTHKVHYLRQPFKREPDFGFTSMSYDFAELLARSGAPS